LDASTGILLSSYALAGIGGNDLFPIFTGQQPLGGLAEADGVLVVPAGNAVVAF
jgi:hypothetical protein